MVFSSEQIQGVLDKPREISSLFVKMNDLQNNGWFGISNTRTVLVDTLFDEIVTANSEVLFSDIDDEITKLKGSINKLMSITDDIDSKLLAETDNQKIPEHRENLDKVFNKIDEITRIKDDLESERQNFYSSFFSQNAQFKLNTELFNGASNIPVSTLLIGSLEGSNTHQTEVDALVSEVKANYEVVMEPEDMQKMIVPKQEIWVKFQTINGKNGDDGLYVPFLYSDANFEYSYGYNFKKDTIALFSDMDYTFNISPISPMRGPRAPHDYKDIGIWNVGMCFVGLYEDLNNGTSIGEAATYESLPKTPMGTHTMPAIKMNGTNDRNLKNSQIGEVFFFGSVVFKGKNLKGFIVSDNNGELHNPNDIGIKSFVTIK